MILLQNSIGELIGFFNGLVRTTTNDSPYVFPNHILTPIPLPAFMSSKSLLRHLVSAGLLVSGGILLGRLTGFLREVAVASKFGVSREADVVLFSLSLPDFLVSILMGGALAAALIPEFKRATVQTADLLFLQSSLLVGAGFSILVVLLIWQAEALIYLFAPGFDPASVQASRFLLNLVLWLMPLTALAGVTMFFTTLALITGTVVILMIIVFEKAFPFEFPWAFSIIGIGIVLSLGAAWLVGRKELDRVEKL